MILPKESQAGMAPNRLFEYVLKNYYHRPSPIPPEDYISATRNKPLYVRKQVARHCRIPQIVEVLINDSEPEVAKEARHNNYWQLLGQFRPLLSLSEKEKIEFIRRESFTNLLVFVVFETDLKVRKELYLHPSISVQMLIIFRRIMLQKSQGQDVESHVNLIQSVISKRRCRLFRIASIFEETKTGAPEQCMSRVLPYLLDEDEVVVKSAVNTLKQYDYEILRKIILAYPSLPEPFTNNQQVWILLEKLQEHYRLPVQSPQRMAHSIFRKQITQKHFLEDVYRLKVILLENCAENLSDSANLIAIARAYLDKDKRIRQKLTTILNLEEIFALVSDPSFPQAVSYHIMNILRNFPSESVQKRISDIFLEINKRTRRGMREMELSVDAYFDIIFSLLGYPQIHKIRKVFQILESARKLTTGFLVRIPEADSDFEDAYRLYGKLSEFYQGKLSKIYLDLNDNRVAELEEVYEMIMIILGLPEKYVDKEGYHNMEVRKLCERVLNKTRAIWRSALGQYLGRLKELDEMIRRKWLHRIPGRARRVEVRKEMQEAVKALETSYKEKMNCKFRTMCRACKKRPCASERYLRQVEFFLGELLEELDAPSDAMGIQTQKEMDLSQSA